MFNSRPIQEPANGASRSNASHWCCKAEVRGGMGQSARLVRWRVAGDKIWDSMSLPVGARLASPAVIEQNDATTALRPKSIAWATLW
jgi:hypothetical protein